VESDENLVKFYRTGSGSYPGERPYGGVNKFPWETRARSCFATWNLFNGKVFCPIYLFKVRGVWNKRQIHNGGVVK